MNFFNFILPNHQSVFFWKCFLSVSYPMSSLSVFLWIILFHPNTKTKDNKVFKRRLSEWAQRNIKLYRFYAKFQPHTTWKSTYFSRAHIQVLHAKKKNPIWRCNLVNFSSLKPTPKGTFFFRFNICWLNGSMLCVWRTSRCEKAIFSTPVTYFVPWTCGTFSTYSYSN